MQDPTTASLAFPTDGPPSPTTCPPSPTTFPATPDGAATPDQIPTAGDVLTDVLRDGARRILAAAIEWEVDGWIQAHRHLVDASGHRQVVRNGFMPPRTILTGLGPIPVKQPRVHDRRPGDQREKFTSKLLPPYLRKTKSVEALIPWMYLKGISTNDFNQTLQSLLGPNVKGLSPTQITRMKRVWEDDYRQWNRRSLADKKYVYVWADGVYFNIRLEDEGNNRQCILVLMGATAQGQKELIAVTDGYRESRQSWQELIGDCQRRGLTFEPKLAIGDGALGFWSALAQQWPTTRGQRCWVHKAANVLNKMPKHLQGKAHAMLHDTWMAATRKEAHQAFDGFIKTFEQKYPAAVNCLSKDRESLLAFYDFPAEQWMHLRTTNPIESTFSTVRLRTNKTRGHGSRIACLTMVFKLVQCAQRGWRALNKSDLIPEVIDGVVFVDGIKTQAA